MASFNKIILLGNVGQMETKTFADGGKVVNVSLATTNRWTGKDGKKNEETQWHTLRISGKQADIVEQYVSKGDPLLVEGEMTYRKWTTQQGENRLTPEVRVRDFQLLGGKKDGGQQTGTKEVEDLPF